MLKDKAIDEHIAGKAIKYDKCLQFILNTILRVLNALGARGYVFAPYCANELANYIVSGAEIDTILNPDRLFWNWVRKIKR